MHVRLYEARDRVGGRCWTARGFADGQTAEHGGEFIDTRHVHLIQLAKELDLHLTDLWKGYSGVWPIYVDGHPTGERTCGHSSTRSSRRSRGPRGTSAPCGRTTGQRRRLLVPDGHARRHCHGPASMFDWLDRHVPGVLGHARRRLAEREHVRLVRPGHGRPVGDRLDRLLPDPLPRRGRALARARRQRPGDRRRRARLPKGTLVPETPLEAIRRRHDGRYELRFTGVARPQVFDFVVLTMPYIDDAPVDYSDAGFGQHTIDGIHELGMGTDSKVLLQYDRRFQHFQTPFGKWSGGLEFTPPAFDTWEQLGPVSAARRAS